MSPKLFVPFLAGFQSHGRLCRMSCWGFSGRFLTLQRLREARTSLCSGMSGVTGAFISERCYRKKHRNLGDCVTKAPMKSGSRVYRMFKIHRSRTWSESDCRGHRVVPQRLPHPGAASAEMTPRKRTFNSCGHYGRAGNSRGHNRHGAGRGEIRESLAPVTQCEENLTCQRLRGTEGPGTGVPAPSHPAAWPL